MSYLSISLVPPIADIDGISRQSELSQRFTSRFSWRRKYNQEWQVWWLMLVGCDEMSFYKSLTILSVTMHNTFLHSKFFSNHVVRSLRLQKYSVRCPIETVWCSACAPHCRDMHSITECYVSVTSRIWCAIRASLNLFCALSIIDFFTTEWSMASIQKSKLALECTLHGVYNVGWGLLSV